MLIRILLVWIVLSLCSCGAKKTVDNSTDISKLYAVEGIAPYQKYRYLFIPQQAADLGIDSTRMVHGIKSMRVYGAQKMLFDSVGDSAFVLQQEYFFNEFGQTKRLLEFEYEELGAAPTSTAITTYDYDHAGKLLKQFIYLNDTTKPAVEYYWHHYYTGTAPDGSTINFKSESSQLTGAHLKYVIDSGVMQRLEATEKFEGSIAMTPSVSNTGYTYFDDVDWSVVFNYKDSSKLFTHWEQLNPRVLETHANNQIFKYCPTGVQLSRVPGDMMVQRGMQDSVVIAQRALAKNGKTQASIDYKYDEAGRIVKQTFTSKKSPSQLMHPSANFVFDEQGLVTFIEALGALDTAFIRLEYAFH